MARESCTGMAEYRYYQRGRRFLSYMAASNLAALALGESIPYRQVLSRSRRLWDALRTLIRLGQKPVDLQPLPPNPNYLWFGGLHLQPSEATGHFAVIGSTGSGKTLTLDSFEESALRYFRPGADQRALIFDVKREKYSKLQNLNLPVEIHLMDPFDTRGVSWRIRADVTTPAEAAQAAACLIQSGKNEGDNQFWIELCRSVVAAVFENLAILYPATWTLRDALLILRSRARLAHFLMARSETAHVWEDASVDEKTCSNLMVSLKSHLKKLEVVAALWQHQAKSISLKEWVKSDSILLITSHPKYSASLQLVHQALFDLLTDLVLSESDSRLRRTYFFLDEAKDLGRLPKLPRLANLGRSKGTLISLGLQSIEGFNAVYTEPVASEILGNCRNKSFLRTDSQTTANWIEKHFGQVEWLVEQVTHSSSNGKGGYSSGTSTSHTRRRESILMASEVMNYGPPNDTQPVVLFNDIPSIGCYVATIARDAFIENLRPANPAIPNVIEAPDKHQRLTDWQKSDAKRLKLPADLLQLSDEDKKLLLDQLENLNRDE